MLFLGHLSSYSQNLVANGSFEDENLCTEYQKYCAPEAWIATSGWANYLFKEQHNAYDGYHYVGLTVGNISKQGIRNFIRTRLLCGLRKGRQYLVEMYVCSTNKVLDSIGVYFSQEDFLYEKRNFKSIQPVFWYQRPRNTTEQEPWAWQKLSFVYTATGDEGYLVIGSFKRTDFKGITHTDFQDDYYFYLDKVSVTPVDPNEKICSQAGIEKMNLYKENDRHELIEKKINNYYKTSPASREASAKLPLTRIPGVVHVDTLVIPDIFFITASYELSKKSNELLDSFAHMIRGNIDSIVVKGHTDSIGLLEYNQELSLNRAISVKQYLIPKINVLGVPVMARGYAYSQPIASNRTQSGRKKNRRVEIFVYRKD
jgi:outer membrane protein OmpA-like peptidoglycan-associated protein